MKKLFIILFILLIPSAVYSASVTVCDTGNGCNYTTIASAISAIQGGVANTITVKSPYTANERVTVNKAGASDANRLVIIADVGYMPVTKGFSVTAAYVTIQGFEMTNAPSETITCYIQADYTKILNNKIHGSDGTVNEVGTPGNGTTYDYVTIKDNEIYAKTGSNSYQLLQVSLNNSTIDHNELHSCQDCDAFWIWGTYVTISNNYVHGITYGNGVNHSDMFQTFGDDPSFDTFQNIVFENNLLVAGTAYGDVQPFNLSQDSISGISGPLEIRNNIFIGFGTQGNIGVPDTHLYNNTFIDCGSQNGWAILLEEGAVWNNDGFIAKNNIFMMNFSPSEGYPIARLHYDEPGEVNVTSNNYYIRWSGSTYYAISLGYAETGAIVSGAPGFTNWTLGTNTCTSATKGTYGWTCSNFDLSLAESSQLIGKGADLSATWANAADRIGTSRPQNTTWDIGAYEFGATTVSTGATATIGSGAAVTLGAGAVGTLY